MIDEAIGKILGMAMAYAVSGLGLVLAYVNYRRRTLRAARVMTPAAWTVLALVVLVIIGGVAVVGKLAQPAPAAVEELAEATVPTPTPAPASDDDRARWPLIGLILPAAIFIAATWITGWLYLHFTRGEGSDTTGRHP